ncbi:MAG: PglZ domain-containing protein [Saprospiraceae bacterium]|nr:PglZ domain-containing protein [Candidatus Vicinibacter affinis]MBP6173448.1 PglZ domain-containing protein [Saprospiraceae bacterium]MBK6823727.1 PglZ domain-containing protein [Candidatus Vicinibacter affinis]MBK7303317.1 PglZ domain-containing protein [Candidatus Vicinibacter affinis]MBK7694939.1 PglZ domain-containing protein [Candidatus Vicinibacter affinis]
MDKIKILWADDEMEHLKPQIFFLEKKGYNIKTLSNGFDALEHLKEDPNYDIIFLDESMPGISGLETLTQIKAKGYLMPVVMVTKNEAENIMEEAIGSQIADYLIKPVNPNQLLLTIKKLIDNKRLVSEKNSLDYQIAFRQLFMEISEKQNYASWVDLYKKLIHWELKLDQSNDPHIQDIMNQQKKEANVEFSKFILNTYTSWFKKDADAPTMSHNLMANKVFKHLNDKLPTFFILLDNLRYDQWRIIEPIISEKFRIEEEDYFYSILPTTTQYSRNSIFAGMLPSEIEKLYPDWWLNDNDEGGKNLKEPELMSSQIKRLIRRDIKHEYIKITNTTKAKQLLDQSINLLNNELTVIVYNFIDMLSHARTEMEVLKELASDEIAYRSLTKSWFLHSPLWAALQKIAELPVQLIITTDHGTIRVQDPIRVLADKETTSNLRYKVGKNLSYDKKEVLEIREPQMVGLPRPNLSSTFIFAKDRGYFLYPNNYGHFLNYYKNTFQHGGISMEEMICPIIRLKSKVIT